MEFNYFCGWVGGRWLGGWLQNWKVVLISTQIVVKVEVEVDIGNNPHQNLSEGGVLKV